MEHIFIANRLNNKSKKRGGKMKNKLLKNIILTVAISSLVAIPVFAQNIKLISAQDIIPISHVFKHWAESYAEKLSVNYDLEDIFKDKDLDDHISAEDFKNAVNLTIDKDYADTPQVTRELIVNELAKIWAEKTGSNLENIPIVMMLVYSDTDDIDAEYQHGVYVAYWSDIAKGRVIDEGRIFDPKTDVTYGELAVLINNTINAIEKENTVQPIAEGRYETKGSYEIKDDKVIFDFQLMSHYTEAQELMFGSGQQFELIITNEDGDEVYRFSDGKFFTMALVYKTLNPGDSFKWQDEWDMTNKDGEKVNSGNYKAEIKILVISEDDGKINDEELTTLLEFSLNNDVREEGIIKPENAKKIIEETANELISALKNKDAKIITDFVHPEKGVRFTPYTRVSAENDLIVCKEDILSFFEDENLYVWGYYDGSGEEIKLTPDQYYEKFVYSEDFINAKEVGYNEVLTSGNMIENQFEVYKNSIIVEYHIPEIDPQFQGLDWQSLRLVFEEFEGNWKLVGIIHNQWTI